jgi:outer membrane protein assembly factor BamD
MYVILSKLTIFAARMKKTITVWLLFAALFFAAGCSEYNKALKSDQLDVKYTTAIKLYEKEDFVRAIPLLEECIGLTRGTQKAEDVYYYYAKSEYGAKDYYLANYYFRNFAKTFSNSARAEECLFLAAQCSYNLSPDFTLDQTDTKAAINELQLFLDTYPASAMRDSANHMVGFLNNKLERKAFESAKLYYTTLKYKGAVTALKQFITDYPSTVYKEECLYLIVKSYYLYAEGSMEEKKLERYRASIESYVTFATAFPNSDVLKDAETYYEKSRRQVEKLTASN